MNIQWWRKDINYFRKKINTELKITRKIVEDSMMENGCLPDAVFDLRATLYWLAMEVAGESRNWDAQTMYELINPEIGETSIDIAAGTGFLTKKLIEWTRGRTFAIDPSEKQLEILSGICPQAITITSYPEDRKVFDFLPIGEIDIVSSFGWLHHNLNLRATFENIARMLKRGGRFCVADVAKDTVLSKYFDEIVDKKCLTGHSMGEWLSEERLHELCDNLPLEVTKVEIKPMTMDFNSLEEMALFFKGLHAYDLTEKEVIEDFENTLGYKKENGKYKLNWPLLFFEIRKK